ncbi:MAG: hypothetical protein ACOX8E_08465, partial [Ruminococcus sp.]
AFQGTHTWKFFYDIMHFQYVFFAQTFHPLLFSFNRMQVPAVGRHLSEYQHVLSADYLLS